MEDEIIRYGCFHIARQIFDSELWLDKPLAWKVIWIYILGNVNHKDKGKFKRGSGFFNFSKELKLIGKDITYNQLREFLRYAKIHKMLNTTKNTRGVTINVLNYNKFQSIANYTNTTENTDVNTTETQQKHNDKQECKNEINKKITNLSEVEEVLAYLNQVCGKHFRNQQHIPVRLKEGYTVEDCKLVIDKKSKDPWFITNPHLMNPNTLFCKKHFDVYLNEPQKGNGENIVKSPINKPINVVNISKEKEKYNGNIS